MPEEHAFDHKAAAEKFVKDGGRIVRQSESSTHAFHPLFPEFTVRFGHIDRFRKPGAIVFKNGGDPDAPAEITVFISSGRSPEYATKVGARDAEGIPSEHTPPKLFTLLMRIQQAMQPPDKPK